MRTKNAWTWLLAMLLAASAWAQSAPTPDRFPLDRRRPRPEVKRAPIGPSDAAAKPTQAAAAGRYEIAQYLNIQSAGGPDYSPATDEIAFLSNITGTNQVYKLTPGSAPKQLTFYEDRVQSVRWSPRGDVLLFTKDQGGNERSQLFVMDANGGHVQALTDNPKVVHSFGDFSEDGKMICYSSNERSERIFDVYVMDLATRQAHRIFTSPDGLNYRARSFSPDGRYVLAERENSNADDDLFLIEVATGKATHLTPHTGEAQYSDAEWAPDGSGFYLAANQDRDKAALAFYDLKPNKLKYLEDGPFEIDGATGITIDRAGTRLVYGCNHNGSTVLKIRDLKSGKVTELKKALPPGIVSSVSFNGDGSRIAFAFTSATKPSDVWTLDVKKLQPRQVTESSLAGIPAGSFAAPREVSYKSFDGTVIPAFLYLPKNADKTAKLPAIVSVHGGPEGQERVGFNPVYQYLLNRGYAILAPNIRGSSGFGKTYIHMDDYKKRFDAIKDVALATDYLKSTGLIDGKKIAVSGGSYGGYMTLAQLTMHPDLWAAGVDIVGIANWATFFKNTGAWRRAHRASEYGDPDKDPEFMASISPINYVDKIKAPLFVVAGANDPRVPKDEADQIVEKVKAKGVPVEYIAFPDEGHGMAKRANRIKAYTAIADFLDRHVNAPAATAVGK
ncbi:MAG: prolyl oligopeptidase family serine peptidase [Terriglobales bacterium]